MTPAYVLIYWLIGNGPIATGHPPFHTLAACEEAKLELNEMAKEANKPNADLTRGAHVRIDRIVARCRKI